MNFGKFLKSYLKYRKGELSVYILLGLIIMLLFLSMTLSTKITALNVEMEPYQIDLEKCMFGKSHLIFNEIGRLGGIEDTQNSMTFEEFNIQKTIPSLKSINKEIKGKIHKEFLNCIKDSKYQISLSAVIYPSQISLMQETNRISITIPQPVTFTSDNSIRTLPYLKINYPLNLDLLHNFITSDLESEYYNHSANYNYYDEPLNDKILTILTDKTIARNEYSFSYLK